MCVTALQSKVKKLKIFCIQVQVLKPILDVTVHLVFSVWHHQVYPLTISRCDNNGTASPPRFVSATQETQKPFHPEFTKQSHWSKTTIKSRHVNVFKGLMKSILMWCGWVQDPISSKCWRNTSLPFSRKVFIIHRITSINFDVRKVGGWDEVTISRS